MQIELRVSTLESRPNYFVSAHTSFSHCDALIYRVMGVKTAFFHRRLHCVFMIRKSAAINKTAALRVFICFYVDTNTKLVQIKVNVRMKQGFKDRMWWDPIG